MTEPTTERVECPICGQEFNPKAAGGWCTNAECGEWQYLGDEVPEPAETDTADADDFDTADEWIQSPPDAGSPGEPVSEDEEAPVAAAGAGEAAESESSVADADATPTDDTTDDELTLEFGTKPGAAEDDSAADEESSAGETDEEPAPDDVETEACPDCGADVAPEDAFCAACGADLEAAETSAAPEEADAPKRLALTARGQEVLVSPDQTVGREIRRIVTETGGDEDDAVLIHREHVRFVREDGQFYVVDLGDNPTELNGNRLSKGDREPVEPGDELGLSDVVTLSVERP